MRSTRHLAKALSSANTATSAKKTATTTATAAGKRAIAELTVYLRTMKAAQRRWAREIGAHESHVRRLMLVEEQHRERLRQQVLKGTREHLKYLTNTDLMAVSQLVSPPAVETFVAYDIPAEQISGFGVYVMGCLGADPNRLRVPLPVLLADLSSAWAILPPSKRDAFTELAEIFRAHVPPRAAPTSSKRTLKTAAELRLAAHSSKLQKKKKISSATRASTASSSPLVMNDVAAARRRVRAATKSEVAGATQQQRGSHARSHQTGCRASRRTHASASTAPTSSPAPPAASVAAVAASLDAGAERHAGAARRHPRGLHHHVVQFETDDVEAFARQLPKAEYVAFCNFAQESLREMELALGASIIPVRRHKTAGSGGRGRASGVAAHSPVLPRGVRLFMKEWLPIAAEEWQRKTRRQKGFYQRAA